MKKIPFGRPFIGEEEKSAVVETLTSGWLAHGPKTKEFEREFARRVGVIHAIATSSGTTALHLALVSIDVKQGDEILVPALTHVATANVCEYQGAKPVFVDIDPMTYNIDVEKMAGAVSEQTKAILPVHFAGLPCDMDRILKLSSEYSLFVVEDAAHAIGAEYKGRKIGGIGDITCFSFYPTKNMTTGEGGMLTTNSSNVAEKASRIRAFGLEKSAYERLTSEKPWYYEVSALGYNYRMTEIAASIGLCQLSKLTIMNERRIQNARYLADGLGNLKGLIVPNVAQECLCVFHVFQLRLTRECKLQRDKLILELGKKGIGTSVYYPLPVPLMPYYRDKYHIKEEQFPASLDASRRTIALPTQPSLSEEDLEYIVRSVKELIL